MNQEMLIMNNLYYECGDGWIDLIKKVISLVAMYNGINKYDSDFGPIEITDIKEKWGLLDVHLNYYIYDLDEKIRDIEKESENICEICGSTENVKRVELHNWVYTRCPKCLEKEEERYNKLFHNE